MPDTTLPRIPARERTLAGRLRAALLGPRQSLQDAMIEMERLRRRAWVSALLTEISAPAEACSAG